MIPRAALLSLGAYDTAHAWPPATSAVESCWRSLGPSRACHAETTGTATAGTSPASVAAMSWSRCSGAASGVRRSAIARTRSPIAATPCRQSSVATGCSVPPARSAVRSRLSSACASSTTGSTPIMPARPLIVWSARNRSRTARGRDAPAAFAALDLEQQRVRRDDELVRLGHERAHELA